MLSASSGSAALTGFLLGLGLIVAIGAQNAFVLRQGLQRRHVLVVTTICALSDAALIAAGVAGLGTLVSASPVLLAVATLGGAAFLAAYAVKAALRALSPGSLEAASRDEVDLGRTIAATLAFTFLNPHVYLDTVVLVGSLSGALPGAIASPSPWGDERLGPVVLQPRLRGQAPRPALCPAPRLARARRPHRPGHGGHRAVAAARLARNLKKGPVARTGPKVFRRGMREV